MSRVERNQHLYEENETLSVRSGRGLESVERSDRSIGSAVQPENASGSRSESGSESVKSSGGSRIAGNLLRCVGYLIIVFVLGVCLGISLPKFAGYNAYVVVSGSMEPNIPVGSIAFAKETDPSQLQVGDVIVFIDPARGTTPITHRVVTNDTAAGTITTKGDANEREDVNPVTYDNVIGKVSMHVPHIGLVATALSSFLGKLIAVILLAEAWLLIEIGRRLKE